MISIQKIVVLALFLGLGFISYSQSFTNRGREFWVGYGHHQFMEQGTNTQEMVLYIYTGDSAATVTVKLEGSGNLIPPPNGGPWTRTYTIPANTVISIEDPMPPGVTVTKSPNCIQAIGPIPKGGTTDCGFDARLYTCPPPSCSGGEGVFKKKGIHITSTASIVAYAHIYGSVSSGATMLMPVQTWGYQYTLINSDQNNATDAYSWMYVISQHDNTWIRITPSVPSRNGRPAGIPFDTVLNRGEIYQLVGKLDPGTNPSSGYNLSGTTVRSIDIGTGVCYPIAVFAGSSRTGGEPPCSASQGGGRDNDMQQVFPEQAWGKRYLTAPFSNSGSPSSLMQCVYKVAVTDPSTIVKVNGVPLTGLILNKYYKFVSTTADYIEADKPVMVAQFMGGGCVSGLGDPEMVYLSPIEQAINDIGFYRNTKEAINVQYLTMIIPTNGVNSLKIDGTLFSAINPAVKHSYPHPNLPGYTVCIRQWAATKAASTAYSDSAFTAITYGEGGAESYGYNAGTFLKNLNALPSIKNQLDTSKQSQFTCTGTSVQLSALLAYKPTQIEWKLSFVKHLFRASNGTAVLTDTTVGNGSTIMNPTDSFVINGRVYYQFPLGYYEFDSLGFYKIPITVKNPSASICNPFEDFILEIEVRQKPVADFTTILPGCPTDSVKFFGAGSSGVYSIKRWFWEFPQGSPSADSSQNTGFVFPGPGSYPVKLTVASLEGCTDDTVKIVTIAPGVTTSFSVNPNTLCQGNAVTITPGPTTTTEWYWDFGDGIKDTTYNGNSFQHTYLGYGVFSIAHSIKSSGTCNVSALPQTVTVFANPFASFNINPPGCLPPNGVVQFTSTANAPDGQIINGHAWNFGDPNATVPNPNTSTLASPTHQYSGVGTYVITYRATTANSCFKDTTVTAVFNVTPAVTFGVLPNTCLNSPAFQVNFGTVTNGVPVTEYYSGPGIINPATGLFDPAVAGIGVHTIWYHATSTAGGCTDSVSQTISVNGIPKVGFTFPTTCLSNGNVQFTDTTILPSGATPPITYTWNFDDPASGGNNSSILQNPSHSYSASGPFNVKLVVKVNGCSDSTIVPVTVRIQPQLSFPVQPPVCGNVAPFTINPAVVTNGVTGNGVYSGPGITNPSTGLFDPTLAGFGTHTIKFIFTSTLNCIDSVQTTISVSTVPKAGFTFPVNCLPNGNVQFGDTSKPVITPNTKVYSWDFGDGSPLNNQVAPAHLYAGSGPYPVKLVVTLNGCSDSVTVPVSVRVQPILSYPPLTGVCGNLPPFGVNLATVTNGVTGSGIYVGPGITNGTAGTFDPSLAGIGTHVIKYIFTSALNCIDSVQSTITVKPVPKAGFTFPVNCLPNGNVQFGDTSKPVITPNTKTYQWNFGDGSPINNQASPAHLYAGSGPFPVKQVVSLNGCSDSLTVPVSVRIQPLLNFPSLASVCANVPAFAVNSAIVTNGVAGSGIYSGPGITNGAAGTFNPSIAGIGTHIIKYIFTSALNCIDSVQSTITVKPVPKAGFTFPVNCLPNGNVQFGDTSKPVITPNTKTYQWNFGDGSPINNQVSPAHLYAGSGPFSVKQVVSLNGCSDSLTVSITVRIQPLLSYPALASVCANVPAFAVNSASVTNGVVGSGIYSGPGITNGVAGTFNPAVAGVGTHVIKFTFTSALNCIDSVKTTITVKPVPKAGFTFPVNCLPNGNVQFSDTSKPIITPNTKTYQWNFGDGSPVNNQASPSHLYSGSGPYSVSLSVTLNGCSDNITKPVTVRVQPQLSYAPLNPVCLNSPQVSVAFGNVTNGLTGGLKKYKGNGIVDTLNGIFDPVKAGVGTHTIKFYYTSVLGCSDSISSTITVKALPVASFTYPTGCLTSNVVPFQSSPVSGGNYSWNFGDPSSGANNTSNSANPTHVYSVFGTYSIKMTVTANGCSDDTTINATFRLQPVISFPPLASVCQANDTIDVNKAVITNGVPASFPGKYSGPGIFDTSGKFNPLIAGAGVHTITYTFTSSGGCVASKTSTITVWPRPAIVRIAFSNIPDTSICIDKSLTINSQVLIASGSIVSWKWNLGDGKDTILNSNAALTYQYDSAKSYKITLTTISNNGCSSTEAAKIVYVRALPLVSFNSPVGVCMPKGLVEFENTSTIPLEDSSTLKYIWDFGDNSAKSSLKNPVHVYNSSLPQASIILDATSAYGCKASDTAVILFYPKPTADFSALPSPVCQGKPITFTNLTTSPNIASAIWDFGDGSGPSSAISPVVIYNGIGEFQPSLFITSTNGCKDTAIQKVKVYLQPVVDAGKSFTVNAGTVVTFQAQVNAGNLTFNWTPATGLNSVGILNPTLTVLNNQTYRLTATGEGGCTATDTLVVNALFALKLPNVFSPNGDGKNDTWDVANLRDYPNSSVEVFNRYGKTVFLSNGKYTKAWDGTFNGKGLPVGTYYYIINLRNGTPPISGNVTIVR